MVPHLRQHPEQNVSRYGRSYRRRTDGTRLSGPPIGVAIVPIRGGDSTRETGIGDTRRAAPQGRGAQRVIPLSPRVNSQSALILANRPRRLLADLLPELSQRAGIALSAPIVDRIDSVRAAAWVTCRRWERALESRPPDGLNVRFYSAVRPRRIDPQHCGDAVAVLLGHPQRILPAHQAPVHRRVACGVGTPISQLQRTERVAPSLALDLQIPEPLTCFAKEHIFVLDEASGFKPSTPAAALER